MDGRQSGYHTQSQGLYTQGASQSQGTQSQRGGGYSQPSQGGWGGGGGYGVGGYAAGGYYGDTASQESYGFTTQPGASTQFNTQEPSQPSGPRCVSLSLAAAPLGDSRLPRVRVHSTMAEIDLHPLSPIAKLIKERCERRWRTPRS